MLYPAELMTRSASVYNVILKKGHDPKNFRYNPLSMKLSILEGTYGVCKLPPQTPIPSWVDPTHFYSVTQTQEELSIVCLEQHIPPEIKTEKGWKIIQVQGPLDFSLTGVLASMTNPLAQANISLFAVSTFDTDYILVKEKFVDAAQRTLTNSGFVFI